jgi:hypothetical protein
MVTQRAAVKMRMAGVEEEEVEEEEEVVVVVEEEEEGCEAGWLVG